LENFTRTDSQRLQIQRVKHDNFIAFSNNNPDNNHNAKNSTTFSSLIHCLHLSPRSETSHHKKFHPPIQTRSDLCNSTFVRSSIASLVLGPQLIILLHPIAKIPFHSTQPRSAQSSLSLPINTLQFAIMSASKPTTFSALPQEIKDKIYIESLSE
jgi:hypothetical protein